MTRFHFPARLQAPNGRELWLVGARPKAADAEALGVSLAVRGLAEVLVEVDGPGPERLAVAEVAARASGAPLVAADAENLFESLAGALAESAGGALALVAGEEFVGALLHQLLEFAPRHPPALCLVSGRATCLRGGAYGGATGWLLAHHNVRDPGSLRQRPEGLGRPS